jgi:hypothetical protein
MIVEVRTYRLMPGTRTDFVRIMAETLPILAAAGIDVVGHGPSIVDEDDDECAYLIRRFATVEERDRLEEAFYSSPAWTQGPREAILSRIVDYHTVVLAESVLAPKVD